MLDAVLFSTLAASSLLVGMAIALVWQPPLRVLGLVMAFGAGALLSAIAFELTDSAIEHGSEALLAAGMLVGAGVYVTGSRMLGRSGDHRAAAGEQEEGDASSIVLGAALDGVPESLAIGGAVAAASGGSMSWTLPIAVALSNLPEALGATVGLRAAGHSARSVVATWTGLVALSALAAAVGYAVLSEVDEAVAAFLDAFTAGAVLAMLTDTMIPDAYRDARRSAGIAAVVGFAFAFLLG